MKAILMALAIAGASTVSAFAQDAMSPDTTACADFTAMDSAAQLAAIGTMEPVAEGDAVPAEETQAQIAAACTAHPDMMVGEALTQ